MGCDKQSGATTPAPARPWCPIPDPASRDRTRHSPGTPGQLALESPSRYLRAARPPCSPSPRAAGISCRRLLSHPVEGSAPHVPVPQRARKSRLSRLLVIALAVIALGAGLMVVLPVATAAPRGTQADLEKLGTQVSQLDAQLNQAKIDIDQLNRPPAAA